MAVDSSRLPREVVRTVVAVSGHKEDNFRRASQVQWRLLPLGVCLIAPAKLFAHSPALPRSVTVPAEPSDKYS